MSSPSDRIVMEALALLRERRGQVQIAVLGDVMLDLFFYGSV